ncbi:MAG: YadA-like family protein [Campylobacter sp.]
MNKIFKHKRGASGLKVVCEFAKSHCSSTEKSAINAGDYVASDLKTDKIKYFISGLKTLSIATIFAVAISSIAPVKAIADVNNDYNTVYWGLRWGLNEEGLFLSSEKTKNQYWNGSKWNPNGRGKQATMLNGYIASGEQSTVVGYGARGTSTQATALGARVGVYGSQGTAIGNDAYATALGAVAIGNDDMHGDEGDINSNGKNLNASRTYDKHSLTEEELKNDNLQKALHNIFCSKGGSADKNGQCQQDTEKLQGFGLKYEGGKYVLDESSDAKAKAGKYSPLLAGGQGSISIGSRSISVGEGSTALGVLAKAYGNQSTALGTLSKAMGKNSFALGANSTATEENSMAFGVNSSATMQNSIAIGYGSKTDYTGSNTKAYMPGNGYAMPMAKSVGVVSVGSNGQPRRIVNLAAGALDTDAVNVSQLKSLAENLGVDDISDNTDKAMRYLSVNRTAGEAKTLQDKIQKEKDFKTYAQYRKYHDTMEVNIKKSGDKYLYGDEKKKLEEEIKRLEAKHTDFQGKLSKPADLDNLTTTSKEEDVKKVLAQIEKYGETNDFKVNKDDLKKHNATNEGATGADALAFGYDAKAEGENAISIGKGATATVAGGIALGAKSEAKIGKEQVGLDFEKSSSGQASTNQTRVWKSTDGAVSVGSDSVSRQITNLAAGTNDTDAVNVAQLKSLGTYVSQGFKVKGKANGNGGTDLENTIKFGSTLEFASADNGFVKVTHTKQDNGNSKFTFDIDKDKLKQALGNIGGGTGGATASNLKFKGDFGNEFTAQNEVNIKGGVTDKTKLSDNNIGVEANGNNTLNVKLAKELKNLTSAEFKNGTSGTTMINGDGITYTPNGNTSGANEKVSLGKDGISAGGKTIQNVGDATNDTDAVNKGQLDKKIQELTKTIQNGANFHFNAEADDANGAKKVANGNSIKFTGDGENSKDGNIKTSISQENGKTTVKFALNETDLKIGKGGANGKDGKITVAGKDNSVTIEGKDGSIGLTKDGTNTTITLKKEGKPDIDGTNGTKMPRLTYETQGANGGNKTIREIATLDDGLKFAGNTQNTEIKRKLNEILTIKGGAKDGTDTTAENIWVETDTANNALNIKMAKALKGLTSAEFKNGTSGTTKVDGDGITYTPNGNTADDKKVSLGKDGISAGGNKITNVKAAENDTDAVNKKQMDEAIKQQITENNTKTELKFAGDKGEAKAQDNKITIAGGQTEASKLSDKPNIGVVAENGKLDIKLAKDIEVDSVKAKNKITVGEGDKAVTIADGKISGVQSSLDPNLSENLKKINDDTSKSDAEKAKEKTNKIKEALEKAEKTVKNNVATVGDLKNITDGLNSAVENVANNITKVTENITKATENIDETKKLIATEDDREKIKKAGEMANFKQDPNKKSEYEDAVKNNPLKTYNPYGTTVKNNTNVVEAIKNINERGVKFMHISDSDKVGEGDDLSVNSNDSQANKKGSIGIGINAKSDAMDAIATGTNSKAEGENSIATGTDSQASGKNSIAMGYKSIASGADAIAMGNGAQATGENSISIGTGNKVTGKGSSAIGDPNTVSGNNSHAYGNNNTIASDNTMVLGNNISVDKGIDQAVALGNQAKISVASGVALGANSNADRQALKSDDEKKSVYNGNDTGVKNTIKGTYGAVSVGDKDNTRQIINVAAGKEDSDAVNVAQLKAVANQIKNVSGGQWIAVSNGAKTAPQVANNVKNAVAVGDGSVANRDNTFSVGSAGNERIISNVADGVAPTDAANMRQLQSVANMVGEVKKDAMAGTASAMAIGNLPQATIPGKGMMAVGVGFYKGEQATALGVSKMSENGRWVFKASASYDSQRNVGAAGAIGFHF